MPKFIVGIVTPYEFDDGGPEHDICWTDPREFLVSTGSVEKAVQLVTPMLSELNASTKKLLVKDFPRFAGKKGYQITVTPMQKIANGIWPLRKPENKKTTCLDV